MNTLSYFIETHGCQMNEHDTEKISGLLIQYGMLPAASKHEADFILLNTCSVREKASHKVFSRLGELKALKEVRPDLLIGVTGCVAQQEGCVIIKRAPCVDLVVGTHQYHTIPEILDDLLSSRRHGRAQQEKPGKPVFTDFVKDVSPTEVDTIRRNSLFRANITIMEGCNKKCAYCIVPFTRGRERNREAGRILKDVREAAGKGYTEIQLLGQTVTNYNAPGNEDYNFTTLLEEVSAVAGIRRIRFVSPHPVNFSDELINLIAEKENICNQVHLPLQSGSNEILKKMRRLHTREWYLELVMKFQECQRHIALSTDIITGFCGESDQDFEDTLEIVRKARFEQMFSFKYSVRPHTEAADWEDNVPEEVKSLRLKTLQDLQKQIQIKQHEKNYMGRIFEVLVEGKSKDGKMVTGRTTTNKVVNFPSESKPGDYVNVKIEKINPNSLSGKEISSLIVTPEFVR
ncbi:MAG: tRNA (N6-isopentenyl adenosine(37)-C2)-methylthiotransferase MiaB [Acidobacteriota bacterium]